ncbi:hypothetical protein ACQP2K_00465 [Microbispora siamensis]
MPALLLGAPGVALAAESGAAPVLDTATLSPVAEVLNYNGATTTAYTPSSTTGTNGWFTGGEVTLHLSATDDDAVASFRVTVGSDPAVEVSAVRNGARGTAHYVIKGDRNSTVRYSAVDAAGNASAAKTITVKIDTKPPLPAPASGSASGSASDSAGAVSSPVDCRTGPRAPAGEAGPWTHPAQSFYGPSDKDRPTRASLEHLLAGDNAVVIEYSPRLPEASIQALREWTYLQTATVAVPGGREPALRAATASTELTCDGVDTIRLSALAGTRTFGRVVEHGDADEK